MKTNYSTLPQSVLYVLLSLLPTLVVAQNNYVATTPSSTTPGVFNTLVGVNAGQNMSSGGTFNTFLGAQAGNGNTTGSQNTFIGYQAGYANSTLGNNTFVGYKAGYANSIGIANVFVGSEAGVANTTGQGNMFLGQQTGSSNTTGNYNLFIGNSSGAGNTAGLGNTAIGDGSLLHNTTGQRNTAIGQYAGVNNNGNYNVMIGFAADVSSSSATITNAVAIGPYAQVNQSNSIVLGNGANVGIGTSAPANKLEITSGTANKSGLRFTNLTGASNSLVSLSISLQNPIVKVLTVDNNGDVVLAGLGVNLGLGSLPGGRLSADAGQLTGALPWSLNGSTIQSNNDSPVTIGGNINRLPAGYKLYVAGGILTERVKVAIKDSGEWADYVFEDNYKLRSLSDVESYIKTHRHLPGVPSANDVAKQGIDVGKMDAKLLEKIEELTLYMLELKKENQEMKKAINELLNNK
ncbi:TMF family protein [Spirosoma foliorum]|uniref:TMF family protein n=1 Tax=Spirosoma foliorum TaxID=2710596 RepID=UPI001F0A7F35|nr:TMF family protein [Spirosoma foliorum]